MKTSAHILICEPNARRRGEMIRTVRSGRLFRLSDQSALFGLRCAGRRPLGPDALNVSGRLPSELATPSQRPSICARFYHASRTSSSQAPQEYRHNRHLIVAKGFALDDRWQQPRAMIMRIDANLDAKATCAGRLNDDQ
jgi:hypothetical protein